MLRTSDPVACLVSPNAADAELALGFLGEGGIETRWFPSLPQAAQALDERTGCLILVEEALIADELPCLREALGRLPAWSDVPLIVVSRDVGTSARDRGSFPDSGTSRCSSAAQPAYAGLRRARALRAVARQRDVASSSCSVSRKSSCATVTTCLDELRNPWRR